MPLYLGEDEIKKVLVKLDGNGTDTSDATITNGSQLLNGVTAYGPNGKITGGLITPAQTYAGSFLNDEPHTITCGFSPDIVILYPNSIDYDYSEDKSFGSSIVLDFRVHDYGIGSAYAGTYPSNWGSFYIYGSKLVNGFSIDSSSLNTSGTLTSINQITFNFVAINLGSLDDGENIGPSLSQDTVTAASMLSGVTAHDNTGAQITGTIPPKIISDISASGLTVSVPAGYYASNASKSISDENLLPENIKQGVSIFNVTGSYTGSGSIGKAYQSYIGYDTVSSSSYTDTDLTITVDKTATYNVSWSGWRNTSSGTSGTQLYIGDTAYGSKNTTFQNTYGHHVSLSNVSLTQGQIITVRARARSSSYVMGVANLIIQEV